LGATANAGGAFRIDVVQFHESGVEAGGVKLADRERADTALGAPGATDEPPSGAADGVSECGIDDLDEFAVATRQRRIESIWHQLSNESVY
jgi:hypothetical protein